MSKREPQPPVPAARVAACAGVTGDARRKWAARQPSLLRAGPNFTSHDAVETAIVALIAKTNQKRGPEAWLSVRGVVRERLLEGTDDLWLVMSAQSTFAQIATDAAEAAHVGSSLDEPVHIVGLTSAIKTARSRFDRELERLSRGQHDRAAVVGRMRR